MTKNIIFGEAPRKKLAILLALGILGAMLLGFSKCASGDTSNNSKSTEISQMDPSIYAKDIEEKVEALCNKIDGVGSTYAVVTLKGGYRAIYATDYQSGSSNSKNQTVVIGSGSSEKALLIGYDNPEISGIGIVCSGGDDPIKRANIISVVSSAFDVSTNKIFVSGT
jgi:stage III sporulation protein AG